MFAARGNTYAAEFALRFIRDPHREFISSDYVKLEVIPLPTWNRRKAELEFYELFFSKVSARMIPTSRYLLETALAEGCRIGSDAMDSIHIACAIIGGAEELVTSEKSTKPMFRTDKVKVVSIFADEEDDATTKTEQVD